MPTIVSIYSKQAYCILRLLNRTDCYVWLYPKNLWLFIYEMHLIIGITDGWLGCEAPPPTKLNVNAGSLSSLYFGIYCSFDFSRLLFFAFSECFPVISGFVYPFKKLPDLLMFLKYFLSVSQWAIQLRVPLTLQLRVPLTLQLRVTWLKPLVTSLHLIKQRLYCKLELCVGLAAVSYNKNILVFSRWLSNTVVLSAFVSRKARLVFLDVTFSILIFFSTVIQKSDCYWVLEQVCTAPVLSKSEKILSLMSLNSKKMLHCQLATAELFPNKTGKHKKMIKARLGLMP